MAVGDKSHAETRKPCSASQSALPPSPQARSRAVPSPVASAAIGATPGPVSGRLLRLHHARPRSGRSRLVCLERLDGSWLESVDSEGFV